MSWRGCADTASAKSEALDQLEMTLEEQEIAKAVDEPVSDADDTPTENQSKRKPRRKPLPGHLHRNEQVLSPGEECSTCGGSLKTLGEDVTEELEYVRKRPELDRMLEQLRDGDVIVVTKYDRLARSLPFYCIDPK